MENEVKYCQHYHIDCGEMQCWAIREECGKVLPCRHEGCLERCVEEIRREVKDGLL